MGQISDIKNPWRDLLQTPASFRGVIFHVESGSRVSGRRTVTHEYPKRNDPYAEDMGRHAVRFQFNGYLIYRPSNPIYQYTQQRIRLIKALEDDDVGKLIHPVHGEWQVMCERYTMTETRERGGYTEFSMSFVQAGSPGNSVVGINTANNLVSKATSLESTVVSALTRFVAENG
jgi:prophage DNA circulation protein